MNKNIEDILKQRFLNKYYFIIENMDLICALYYGKTDRTGLLESIEDILFSNDELKENKGYMYIDGIRYLKGMLISKHYNEYKIRKTMYYEALLKKVPKNNIESINYYKKELEILNNLTEEKFINKMDFEKLVEIMRAYLATQEKHHKNRDQKLKVLYLYHSLYEELHKDEKKKEYDLEENKRTKERYVKTNDFINYFSDNKETFNAEFVRKRNENRNK